MKFNPAPKDPIEVPALIQDWVSSIIGNKNINNLSQEEEKALTKELLKQKEDAYLNLLYQIDYYYYGL